MNVAAHLETPTLQGAASATPGLISTQVLGKSSPAFSDSLLAAVDAGADHGAPAKSASPKATADRDLLFTGDDSPASTATAVKASGVATTLPNESLLPASQSLASASSVVPASVASLPVASELTNTVATSLSALTASKQNVDSSAAGIGDGVERKKSNSSDAKANGSLAKPSGSAAKTVAARTNTLTKTPAVVVPAVPAQPSLPVYPWQMPTFAQQTSVTQMPILAQPVTSGSPEIVSVIDTLSGGSTTGPLQGTTAPAVGSLASATALPAMPMQPTFETLTSPTQTVPETPIAMSTQAPTSNQAPIRVQAATDLQASTDKPAATNLQSSTNALSSPTIQAPTNIQVPTDILASTVAQTATNVQAPMAFGRATTMPTAPGVRAAVVVQNVPVTQAPAVLQTSTATQPAALQTPAITDSNAVSPAAVPAESIRVSARSQVSPSTAASFLSPVTLSPIEDAPSSDITSSTTSSSTTAPSVATASSDPTAAATSALQTQAFVGTPLVFPFDVQQVMKPGTYVAQPASSTNGSVSDSHIASSFQTPAASFNMHQDSSFVAPARAVSNTTPNSPQAPASNVASVLPTELRQAIVQQPVPDTSSPVLGSVKQTVSAAAAHAVQAGQQPATHTTVTDPAVLATATSLPANSTVPVSLSQVVIPSSMAGSVISSLQAIGSVATKPSVSSTNAAKSSTKNAAKEVTASKAPEDSASVPSDPQNDGDTKAVSSDHSLRADASQVEATPVVPNTPVAHSSDAQALGAVASPTGHVAAAATGSASAEKTASVHGQDGASTAAPAAEPQAAVSSARLIQNISQSEMRVGMRSTEFGDISIRTSATRDSISAQISLDHADLAKTLTTHLPEMQARLGGSQTVDVRLNSTPQGSSQSSNQNNSMNSGSDAAGNGADNGSRSSRQQMEGQTSVYGSSFSMGQQLSPVAVSALAAENGGRTGRLDIRA